MSLGTLHVLPLLRELNKVHYGSEDPIRGTVSVRYTTSKLKHHEHSELFAHLRIELRLTGRVEIGRATSLKNARICVKSEVLHDGSVKLMPGSQAHYPFEITFPPHAEPKFNTLVSAEQTDGGQWKFHKRTTSVTTEPLPPTLRSTEHEGVAKRALAIRYILDAVVEMPGFDVDVVHPPLGKDVLYDQPRIPASATAMLSE
ncbi:hypothetical protein DOTSEDRAFT_43885 [Dothistroma septosporum NZE10]|uniref:Arrestin-like N-terminal domain-containing protein n=1 Tax=Dothistroma septosporum (strain NZE10 / CBS 128990) TaxID=675120 RepID=N1PQB2_DOTSN|nr:hypothetical protein DOTSEDRAFT_43885 [Dothistroma septosporum NZE10]